MVDRVTISSGETGPMAPEATPAPAPTVTGKPEWLPEKFWNSERGEANVEALSKSYGELEKRASGKKAEEAPADAKATNDAAKEAVESAGLDFGKLETKFYQTGALEDGDYAALEKAGIPRSIVDNYINGAQLQAQEFANGVVNQVGGKEAYAEMTKWAADNLSPDEVTAYNEAVNSGDYKRVMMAVKALRGDYTAATGREPSLVTGKQTTVNADSYESWAQVTKDMNSIEYKKDPAFRKQVEARLARSNPR